MIMGNGTLHAVWRSREPFFSVIICTYNRRDLLLALLASLYRQTLSTELFEIIVIDNGSQDQTCEALHEFLREVDARAGYGRGASWQVRYLSETRNGQGFARYRALQAALGQVLVFLDDDMLVDEAFLEQLQRAYERTQADAVCGRVDLEWEARRPHWVQDSLLEMLGYFTPEEECGPLPEMVNLSEQCFSIKREVLQAVGLPAFALGKRLNFPIQVANVALTRRLRLAGYRLWYAPEALAKHRISAAHLQQSFFIGRAYWQARAEVLLQHDCEEAPSFEPPLWPVLRDIAAIELIDMPKLVLSERPIYEQLLARMTQARIWGAFEQQNELQERHFHPSLQPAIVFIHAGSSQANWLMQASIQRSWRTGSSKTMVPLSWLWRHRSYMGQSIALLHIYHPGALQMPLLQRWHFRFALLFARVVGVRVVSTDGGGYWQYLPGYRTRRRFERQVFSASDIVLSFTPHIQELYPNKTLLPRVHHLPHPGLRGLHGPPLKRSVALERLGLPEHTPFTFLCLANMHSKRDILYLIDEFSNMLKHTSWPGMPPQLLIIGSPHKRRRSRAILKRAARNPAIHLYLEANDFHQVSNEDLPLCIGAADALVLPHAAIPTAGSCEMAMLFYAHGCQIIAPDLPRFRDLVPENASLIYTPGRRGALWQVLQLASKRTFTLSEYEKHDLAFASAWSRYARKVQDLYHYLLAGIY